MTGTVHALTCASELIDSHFSTKVNASDRKGHAVLSSIIDTGEPMPRRHTQDSPQLRSCNAVIGYHPHASDVDPMSGRGYDQPAAPAGRRTALDAPTVMALNAEYRSGAVRQASCPHPRDRQISPATSTGPITVLGSR